MQHVFFDSYLPDKEKTIRNLLSIDNFQPHIIAVFIQNAAKIFSKLAADPNYNSTKIYYLCSQIEELIKPYLKNQNLEIQERATTLSEIIAIVKSMKDDNIDNQVDKTNLLMHESDEHSDVMANGEPTNDSNKSNVMIDLQSFYYAYPLNPVAAKAQRKVPIPVGLDLDTPFDLPESEEESDDNNEDYEKVIHLVDDEQNDVESLDESQPKNNDNEQLRRFEQENNPNYLKTTKSKQMAKKSKRKVNKQNKNLKENDEDSDKNETFTQESSLAKQNASIPGLISSEKYLLQMKKTDSVKKDDSSSKYKKKTSKKKNTKVNITEEDNEDDEENDNKISIRALEMPEGVDLNDNDEDDNDLFQETSDPHKALAKVNLDDVINDLNKMRQKTLDSKITESKEKSGKKKKSAKKVVKTSVINDLITGKKVVKVAKAEKSAKKNDDSMIKLNDSPAKMKPKKSNKTKKTVDSKNRDEYEETLDKI